jgi:hypothetical protein
MVPLDKALVNNQPRTCEYVITRAEEKTKHVSQASYSHVKDKTLETSEMWTRLHYHCANLPDHKPPHLDMILRQFYVLGVVQNIFWHPQQIKNYEF